MKTEVDLLTFISRSRAKYMSSKTVQASNDYDKIVTPYLEKINELSAIIKALQSKPTKKQRVKVIKKGKK